MSVESRRIDLIPDSSTSSSGSYEQDRNQEKQEVVIEEVKATEVAVPSIPTLLIPQISHRERKKSLLEHGSKRNELFI